MLKINPLLSPATRRQYECVAHLWHNWCHNNKKSEGPADVVRRLPSQFSRMVTLKMHLGA